MQHVTLPHPPHDPLPLVPDSEIGGRRRWIQGASLAFYPKKSPHYKVILVRSSDEYSLYQTETYSSESCTWKLSGDSFFALDCVMFKNGIFCNGAIHWIDSWGPSLYFNVEEERVRKMPMPPVPEGWEYRRCSYFGVSRNHLHLVEIYSVPTSQFDIYEMAKDYTRWSVKFRVNLNAVTAAFPCMVWSHLDPSSLHYHRFEIVCIARQENDEDSYLVLHVPGKIIHYNLMGKTFWTIGDIPDPSDEGFRMNAVFQYVGTFYSV